MLIRSCILLALVVESGHGLRADVLYDVVDIGALPGLGNAVFASGIDNAGQVTGRSGFFQPNGSCDCHAFLYSNGQTTDLHNLIDPSLGITLANGSSINNQGSVAGQGYSSNGTHSFLYSNGQVILLGSLGAPSDFNQAALGVNDAGQATGFAFTADSQLHAFLYSNGHMMDLGVADSAGNDINNSGQITGYYGVDNVRHAFLYSDGRVTNLGALGGAGFALNDAGEVTGVADTTTTENGTPHAFLYSNGQIQDLGTLGGGSSVGLGINDLGQVVGYSDTTASGSRAFLYSNGQIVDLNSLIDPVLGVSIYAANGINQTGQIIAQGYNNATGVREHGYLLTPIPEPSTILLMGAGVAFAAARRWNNRKRLARLDSGQRL